jgi:tRNA-specific 2-thiouridylase
MFDCIIDWINDDILKVKLDNSDSGIAPGQFAVFYDEDVCLGGGVILEDSD